MNATYEVLARCTNCDEEGHIPPVSTKPRAKTAMAQAHLWATAHYDRTGHHRFVFETVERFEESVARIRDPNQLALSDDPNYSTFTLGDN